MAKNIVIFSDGTGQKGGENTNTNIYKMFNMVEDRTQRQVAFYDAGIGTGLAKLTGNLFGRGFNKNVLDCYRFIFDNYEAGDSIFLFGFSRGAATVRSLSAFIHLFGMLPKSREDLIEKAFEIYEIKNLRRKYRKSLEFIAKNHNMWVNIEFLGVFDTVAALGLQNKFFSYLFDNMFHYKFHSFELSYSVKHARHALSIDEERELFAPVVWNKLNKDLEVRSLKQVWFCGVHTDVGGGYQEEELSNVSLHWMLREAKEKGLLIYEKAAAYKALVKSQENIDGTMHNELKGFIGKLFSRKERTWNEEVNGKLVIHKSVLGRKKSNANLDTIKYEPWILKREDYEIEE